ncbi:MAG TPA: NUDIX domain-containing protein [Chitinophagaceae bacterium]|nr:NUDIX domain-containing protein [Chitinophagaceae bacterium]
MNRKSAGILLFRIKNKHPEFLLVHPGGPFFAKKDLGAWTIPKGELMDDEPPLDAAKREFREELGVDVSGKFIELTPVKQKGGKLVYAWAVQGDIDPDTIQSNSFEMEWPPHSGRKTAFKEIDKAAWFDAATAKQKINPAQAALVDEIILQQLGG